MLSCSGSPWTKSMSGSLSIKTKRFFPFFLLLHFILHLSLNSLLQSHSSPKETLDIIKQIIIIVIISYLAKFNFNFILGFHFLYTLLCPICCTVFVFSHSNETRIILWCAKVRGLVQLLICFCFLDPLPES